MTFMRVWHNPLVILIMNYVLFQRTNQNLPYKKPFLAHSRFRLFSFQTRGIFQNRNCFVFSSIFAPSHAHKIYTSRWLCSFYLCLHFPVFLSFMLQVTKNVVLPVTDVIADYKLNANATQHSTFVKPTFGKKTAKG